MLLAKTNQAAYGWVYLIILKFPELVIIVSENTLLRDAALTSRIGGRRTCSPSVVCVDGPP